nr:protein EXORDIUM-like 7 [Ipomoea batatas]GME01421.1 protein EXORDIUM-like 7 [Ipomoea batatas]GME14866.1 protein EXORDIUM-like 7 [Ipomoea batatas]
MQKLHYFNLHFLLLCFLHFSLLALSRPSYEADNYEGSSDLVNLEYHMGPVLASPINLYIIWYGSWNPGHQATVRDFLRSLSPSSNTPHPSVADWWRTVRLYSDQTGGNVTGDVAVAGEYFDFGYSHGKFLSRLSMQRVIKTAVASAGAPLNYQSGLYLVLTSHDVEVQDFCRAVCGFHYFTFTSVAGVTVPYAWVGYSGTQCPGMCAYPFAWPEYSGRPPNGGSELMGAPNGDAATDGMISVLAHELAEVSSNPLVNAWYAGDDPSAPTEIADLCLGVYGSGAGGGYVGEVYKDSWGNGFNLHGVNGRRFLVQWVWNPIKKRCFGPNAMD